MKTTCIIREGQYIAKEQDKTTKPNLDYSMKRANLGNYIIYSFRWNQGNGVNNKYIYNVLALILA